MTDGISSTKFINYCYVITEMIDDMNKTIDNLNKVVESQVKLVSYLEKSKDKDMFAGFIDELKKANEQYSNQIKILEYRIECAKEVHNSCESKEVERVLSLLLETFGIANKEAKSLEERLNNNEVAEEVALKA